MYTKDKIRIVLKFEHANFKHCRQCDKHNVSKLNEIDVSKNITDEFKSEEAAPSVKNSILPENMSPFYCEDKYSTN